MDDASSHRGGRGEPLVCIHGFSDTWRAWRPLLPALEARHDVLCVTLAGHLGGEELPPGAATSKGAIADVVERGMDAAGFETAHLVGNSLGGWVALELASRGRARSVVGISPAGGWEPHGGEERRIYRLFWRNYWGLRLGGERVERLVARPRFRTLALAEIVARPRRVPPAAARDMLHGAANCAVYMEALNELRAGDFPPELGQIDCPVRIAWGTRDRVLPLAHCRDRFRQLVPEAEYVDLDGLGHVPMWDDPELVARTILDFTARTETGARAAVAG